MKHYYQNIDGFFNFSDIYTEMVNKFTNGAHFVEIGSWMGKSSIYMGIEIINSKKNIKFDCIDNWKYGNGDIIYIKFLKNIKTISNRINHYRLDSVKASTLYQDSSLDFIYIDASHEYNDVKDDLYHWYPKLKKGGIIAGHDYHNRFSGLKKAVNEFFSDKEFEIDYRSYSWVHKK